MYLITSLSLVLSFILFFRHSSSSSLSFNFQSCKSVLILPFNLYNCHWKYHFPMCFNEIPGWLSHLECFFLLLSLFYFVFCLWVCVCVCVCLFEKEIKFIFEDSFSIWFSVIFYCPFFLSMTMLFFVHCSVLIATYKMVNIIRFYWPFRIIIF